MAILHTINQSPDSGDQLRACLSRVLADSAVILYEDGVYAALDKIATRPNIELQKLDCKLYAVREDCEARGLQEAALCKMVTLIDYPEFVELVTQYDVVQAWS